VSLVKKAPEGTAKGSRKPEAGKGLALSFLSWGVTILLVAVMILVLFRGAPFTLVSAHTESTESPAGEAAAIAELPAFTPAPGDEYLVRLANLNTTLPKDARSSAVKYTVQPGDSIFPSPRNSTSNRKPFCGRIYDL